ncbi:MAG: hypothetical protein HOK84_05080, partial [Bacteroidetes bacterium]|nr:hypothetical protein [Bacteroidota bacterium]
MNTQKTNMAEIEISYSRNIITDNTRISCSRDADQVFRRIFPSLQHREYF